MRVEDGVNFAKGIGRAAKAVSVVVALGAVEIAQFADIDGPAYTSRDVAHYRLSAILADILRDPERASHQRRFEQKARDWIKRNQT